MLTDGAIRALRLLLDQEEGEQEIACEGLEAWIGLTRIARRTVSALVWHMAVTTTDRDAGFRRYTPTANAAKILARPALADEMVARVLARKPFFVDDNGVIQDA